MNTTTQLPATTGNSVNDLDNIDIVDIAYKNKSRRKTSDRPVVKSSRSVFDIIHQYWNRGSIDMGEEIIALLLSNGNTVMQLFPLSGGVPAATGAHVTLILEEALRVGACCMVLVHNRPKQYVSASKTEHAFAKKIKQAAAIFDITLHDYLVIYSLESGYYSFADAAIL